MATSYPTSIDAFTNPTGASLLTSPNHAGQHSDVNDAVEAIETAIGTTAAPVLAKLASPTFTGIPAAPTAAVATNTTQLATTAFVIANAGGGISKAQRASTMSIPGVAISADAGGQTVASLAVIYNPVVVTNAITITSLSVQCDGAGAAGSQARLSIYNADSSWVPTTLVLDAGTVSLTSTGTKTISSLSTSLPAGSYYFRIQGDSTVGTRPTLYTTRGYPINWQFFNAAGTQMYYQITATATSYVAAEATVTNLPTLGGTSTGPFLQFMKAVWT